MVVLKGWKDRMQLQDYSVQRKTSKCDLRDHPKYQSAPELAVPQKNI